MYFNSDVFKIRPSNGRCLARNIGGAAQTFPCNGGGLFQIAPLSATVTTDPTLPFHYVGAWTTSSASYIASGGANKCVDFQLIDKNGKPMLEERQQVAGGTSTFDGGRASTAPEVCRINWVFPANGLFLACHAGWSGGNFGAGFKPPGPLPCVGLRGDNQNPFNASLGAVNLTWLPVVGDLQTIKATVPGSTVTFNPAPNNEFYQFLVVFVQSQAFPAFF